METNTPQPEVTETQENTTVENSGVLGEAEPRGIEAYETMFKNYYPLFCKMSDELTSSELKRLCRYLVGFPLEVTQEQIAFKTDKGTDTFSVGYQLMQLKFGLTLKALEMNMAKPDTETETTETPETTQETNGENING